MHHDARVGLTPLDQIDDRIALLVEAQLCQGSPAGLGVEHDDLASHERGRAAGPAVDRRQRVERRVAVEPYLVARASISDEDQRLRVGGKAKLDGDADDDSTACAEPQSTRRESAVRGQRMRRR